MAEVIKMPRMSDTMTEGVIVEWHKKVGDKVKPGDLLAEVETDKATMELESYNEGTILYIGVEKGKSVKVEEVIAVIGKEGEDYKAALGAASGEAPKKEAEQKEELKPAEKASASNGAPKAEAPQKQAPAVTPEQLGVTVIRMPLLSDTMTEGKIVQWNKQVGDKVKSDDNLADVETDKATMEVVGYTDGTLLYIGTPEGEAAKVNDVIAIIGKEGTDVSALVASLNTPRDAQQPSAAPGKEQAPAATAAPQRPAAITPGASEDGRIKASPLAKKIAKDKGVDLKLVQGSGDGGRIIKKDIDNYTPAAPATATAPAAATVPAFTAAPGTEGYTDISLNQIRKVIARRLSESKFAAPHFYLTMEIVMDNAIAARAQMNEVSPAKISFNDMVVKAAAMALRRHPAVNSSWMNESIRQWHHIHVGIAVAIEDGLIVPVVRFADQKSLSQIAAESKELSGRARNKKLQPNEFSGNTFTISNLGMMDIDEFTAIINPPDSAIMAVGRIKETVVKKGDGFGVSNIMKITLSCDHRSVDGAVGAAFLQTFKKYLENPVTMLV